VREINLEFINQKLELKTDCDEKTFNQIEEHINNEFKKLNINNLNISQIEIASLLLIKTVHKVLSLTKERDENFEKIKCILSKI